MASHYSEWWKIIQSTTSSSVRQKAPEERERARGREKKIPANWLSKSIPEQWSVIGFRCVVYPRCDSELFIRPCQQRYQADRIIPVRKCLRISAGFGSLESEPAMTAPGAEKRAARLQACWTPGTSSHRQLGVVIRYQGRLTVQTEATGERQRTLFRCVKHQSCHASWMEKVHFIEKADMFFSTS